MKNMIVILCTIITVQIAAANDVMRSALPESQDRGADAAVLETVAKALAVQPFVYYASFKRRLIMMENGDIDLMCGLLKRPERERYIYFVQPPYKTRSDTVFYMLKAEREGLTSYDDLKHLTIGVTRGTTYFPRFDRDQTLKKMIEPHADINFRKLLLNRLDVVVINEFLGIDLVKQLDASSRVGMAPFRFSGKKNVYFGISRKSWMMQDLDRIKFVLKQMIETGHIRDIITENYHRRNLPVPAM